MLHCVTEFCKDTKQPSSVETQSQFTSVFPISKGMYVVQVEAGILE